MEHLVPAEVVGPQHRHQKECQDSLRNVTLEGEVIEELKQIENLDITEPEFQESGQDNSPSNFSSEARQDNFLRAVELESHFSSMVVTQASDNPEVNQPRKGMYNCTHNICVCMYQMYRTLWILRVLSHL